MICQVPCNHRVGDKRLYCVCLCDGCGLKVHTDCAYMHLRMHDKHMASLGDAHTPALCPNCRRPASDVRLMLCHARDNHQRRFGDPELAEDRSSSLFLEYLSNKFFDG